MLDVRSTLSVRGLLRLVLLGTLDNDDLPLATRAFVDGLSLCEDRPSMRIVMVKLWRADRESLELVRHCVRQARALGVECLWCGPLPDVQRLLEECDESEHVRAADTGDLRAARGWSLGHFGRP
jgi:hypothetical protein